ncbi:MAG: aspartate 1-decarboxylase [Methylocella sp.]
MLKAKIHRARLTSVDIDYEGSIEIDSDILDRAGINSYEKVAVWNVTNGNRLETYAIAGPRGGCGFLLNGAAAHLASAGDVVIITAFCNMPAAEAKAHVPRVLLMDENNHFTEKSDLVEVFVNAQ